MRIIRFSYLSIITVACVLAFLTAGCEGPGTNGGTPDWGTPVLIETNNEDYVDEPQIACDNLGNAIAVWGQFDGDGQGIWANRYVSGNGWGDAVLIDTDVGDAYDQHIAMHSSGNAIVVWRQDDGSRYSVYASHYVPASGWGPPIKLETSNAGHAYHPQIAIDNSGNAIAVWEQWDVTDYGIWANRYVSGVGWGTAELIETDETESAEYPQVAFDDSGNAIAVWIQGSPDSIWANRYVSGVGWGIAELIEADDTGAAAAPHVRCDSPGNGIAVWQQNDGERYNIYANRYVSGMGWGMAELIETDNAGIAENPQIVVCSSGNAIAVWQQSDGLLNNICVNHYVSGTGWGTPVLIDTNNAGNTLDPQIAMNSSGDAFAVWVQIENLQWNIYANRYISGTGWGTPLLIDSENAESFHPQIACDSSGNAFAIWLQNEDSFNLYANTYH